MFGSNVVAAKDEQVFTEKNVITKDLALCMYTAMVSIFMNAPAIDGNRINLSARARGGQRVLPLPDNDPPSGSALAARNNLGITHRNAVAPFSHPCK